MNTFSPVSTAKVVLAPDKFKGSLTAAQVAAHLADGIRAASRDVQLVAVPVADGGDGTLDAAIAAGFEPVPYLVSGLAGTAVQSRYVRRGNTAVVELADACGLARLPGGRLAPLTADTVGFGELVGAALDDGCTTIVLAVGGSASTDAGAGMLVGLGARLLDADGRRVRPGLGQLRNIATVDLTGLHPKVPTTTFVLACDVDNPLLGPSGAAAVYGPQKGVADVAAAEDAVHHFAQQLTVALGTTGPLHPAASTPGAGAAGGAGFAAIAVLHAQVRAGIDYLLELTGFQRHLDGATLVVTGEGCLDEQTLHGKAPAGIAAAARAHGVPVIAVAGRSLLTDTQLEDAGISGTYLLTDQEPDLARCVSDAGPLLRKLAEQHVVPHHLSPALPTEPTTDNPRHGEPSC